MQHEGQQRPVAQEVAPELLVDAQVDLGDIVAKSLQRTACSEDGVARLRIEWGSGEAFGHQTHA